MRPHTIDCRGVFFDVYGTLVVYGDMQRAWRDWMTAFHRALTARGLAMDEPSLAERCHGMFSEPEPPDDGRGLTVFERRVARLAGELGLHLAEGAIRGAAHAALAAWHRHIRPDPEARPALAALAHTHVLAAVSNFDHPPRVHATLRELGLADAFRAAVVSGEVGPRKPDPAIFRIALDRVGLEPGDVVHVGDSMDDVEGALAAGIRPVLLRRPGDVDPAAHVDYDAESPGDAPVGPGNGLPAEVVTVRGLDNLADLLA